MGWNLDYSAITPGPGGTVMLGEKGGAEAVARRAKERRARERELALQKGRLTDDTMAPDGGQMVKAVTEGGTPEISGEKKSGFRARWREFRERNLP
ncbi:hypothetical protein BDV37DRAFT_284639 [Aspergillus pseudonomiae]|uniref:Uncharacterized protein n=1 Tax=Aspergillus pseudonomiae TaxID=1506151 RepID=A0A5N7D7T6_9EURO|nr:uncharacterized protein BDV37DRAFT_284639 [Aspergillus pseudonomiae]KAE8402502.1 hypothetical protein BDV37DRAFT_284639 [Aspergillus pseudonomiae]